MGFWKSDTSKRDVEGQDTRPTPSPQRPSDRHFHGLTSAATPPSRIVAADLSRWAFLGERKNG